MPFNLSDYGRPEFDTGTGIHLGPDASSGAEFQRWAFAASLLHVKWVTTATCYRDELVYLASLGIQPLCRPKRRANEDWGDDHNVVANLLYAALGPYVQIYNEPESAVEWPGGEVDEYAYIQRWIYAAEIIHAQGGYPGIQLMDPLWLEDLLDEIVRQGKVYLLDRVWFACHNYGSNKPNSWPYDSINQTGLPQLTTGEIDRIRQDPVYYPGPSDESRVIWWTDFTNELRRTNKNPGQTIFDDWKGFMAPVKWNEVFVRKLGRSVPIICTEGNAALGDNMDGRYLRVDEADHAAQWAESFTMFAKGKLPNGDPLPDYWFANTGWLIASELAAGPAGEFEANALYSTAYPKQATIDALLALPVVERRFSWSGATPDPTPDPVPVPDPTPDPIPTPATILKLGPHSQEASSELLAAIVKSKPRLVKVMFQDSNFVRQLRAALPHVYIIGRLFDQGQLFLDDPAGRGLAFADKVLNETPAIELYDAVESYNEWFGYNNPNDWALADQFQASFYDRIKQRCARLEPIAGNCGTGNLLGSDWVAHFPLTLARYRLYGLHEYGWPNMQHDDGWRVLRYRKIMPAILMVRPDALAIITECGMTNAAIGGPDIGFWSIMSPEEYWSELQWYNDRLNEDAYVLGATVFEIGGRPDWASFEVLGTSIIDRMAEIPTTPIVLSIPPIIIPEPGGDPVPVDQIITVLHNMWTRQGVNVSLDDGFFKAAVTQARVEGVYVIPQPSPDGNFTTDIGNYRIAYTMPPMWVVMGDWGNVHMGLPF